MLHLTWNFIFDINANMCLHRNGQVAAFLLSCEFLICFIVTISSLKTHFFINRILDPITGDVMNIVPLSTRQYGSNTKN